LIAAVFLIISLRPAAAAPIIFTHAGSGSGRLGSTVFPTSNFVITAVGNTDSREIRSHDFAAIFSMSHSAANIFIDGLGEFAFTSPTRTFLYDPTISAGVGFARGGQDWPDGADLFDGPDSPELTNWQMLTGIGPVTGPGMLVQWGIEPAIQTSAGVLFFDDRSDVTITFTAVVVPEPLMLYQLALAGVLAGAVRRRILIRCG
jgi:hypothetical protein